MRLSDSEKQWFLNESNFNGLCNSPKQIIRLMISKNNFRKSSEFFSNSIFQDITALKLIMTIDCFQSNLNKDFIKYLGVYFIIMLKSLEIDTEKTEKITIDTQMIKRLVSYFDYFDDDIKSSAWSLILVTNTKLHNFAEESRNFNDMALEYLEKYNFKQLRNLCLEKLRDN